MGYGICHIPFVAVLVTHCEEAGGCPQGTKARSTSRTADGPSMLLELCTSGLGRLPGVGSLAVEEVGPDELWHSSGLGSILGDVALVSEELQGRAPPQGTKHGILAGLDNAKWARPDHGVSQHHTLWIEDLLELHDQEEELRSQQRGHLLERRVASTMVGLSDMAGELEAVGNHCHGTLNATILAGELHAAVAADDHAEVRLPLNIALTEVSARDDGGLVSEDLHSGRDQGLGDLGFGDYSQSATSEIHPGWTGAVGTATLFGEDGQPHLRKVSAEELAKNPDK